MPENRVKEAINKRIWIIDERDVRAFYKDHKLNDKKFYRLIQDADISFTKSIRSGRHKVYDLTFTDGNNKEAHCLARMTDESFVVEFIPFVRSVKILKKALKNRKSTAFSAGIVHAPKNKNLVYSDTSPGVKEHLRSLGINNDIQLQKVLLSGAFDYQKSRLNEQPRPVHVFNFRPTQHVAVSATCIWYKDKIKVYELKETPLNF